MTLGTVLVQYGVIHKLLVGALSVLVVALSAAKGSAQVSAPPSGTPPPTKAQMLALEALDYQKVGENALDREAKMRAFRRGVELARQAIAADDQNADAHFALFANQGRVMELEGIVVNPFTVVEATRELNRALELNPNHADALAAKGGIYRQLPWALGGSDKKAMEYLVRSVELDYENACGARIELAELYRQQGQPEHSIPLLQKAVEVAKRDNKTEKLARAQALLAELSAR